jgi:ubiquinone/menaquinone biosynthesis C-methylase UbiE
MSGGDRITDYDRIADRYDTRYAVYAYDGVRDVLLNFLGPESSAILEVGCGTGHWLPSRAFGLDVSAGMLARAQSAHPHSRLVRGRAEALPWRDASLDRIYCVNALHHFTDRTAFFAEARRVLKPGGALLTIGKDPHTERDDWWVYTYFEQTREIDCARYARVRTLRGEMALAGFAWTESMEADHIEVVRPASEAIAAGVVDPSFTSQLTVLSDEEYAAGAEKLRLANESAGGQLQLVADFRLYATIGWVA